jgi:ATP-dependent helicase/nuclease subunit A
VERRLRASLDLPVRGMTVLAHADTRAPGRGHAFTDEQLAAIERRDGPLLLSASAGSGKTSVLVERFVRSVVEDGLRPAEVLAITFTDKAAGELRSRVRARLLEAGEREAARDAEAAWIMTFHGFCARVLRAHAVAAGLDPAFAVLEEPGARALRREAFDAALATFLADRPDGGARTDALDVAAAYTPDRLADMVWDAHDHLRSRGQTRPRLPAAGSVDLAAARAALDAAAAGAASALAGARSLVTIDRARAAVASCREMLAALPAGAPASGAALKAATFAPGSAAELREPATAGYLDALAAYGAACRDARARPVLALLDELLGTCADAYAAAKRARSAVDFDDLELLTRDLLARAPAAAAGYAERFARIMVDEFQDTNPLQLEILGFLDRGHVFTVGDELQSIYAFRHADVSVFRARRAALAQQGAAATLATSFRARPEILETIDAAFAGAHGASWVALRPGRDEPPDDEPRVELLLTDAARWEGAGMPELGDGLPAAPAARHAEARLVAQRIADLVRDGEARAGDVAVLLRAATDIGLYERSIELEGLAALSSGGRGWWGRRQVKDLCCYLGALANPRDEQALLGLLASPLVGASSDALALLAMAARAGRGVLWDAVAHAAVRLPRADAERLETFRGWFAAERGRAGRLSLDELLARVVRRTGYDLHVLALPGGARRLANVHKLMRLAADFEARRGRDVRGFIDLATAELEADAREPDAPVDLSGLQAVRLMTIHAAKGLEFPVVVVADLGRRGSTRHPDLLEDGDRVGLRLVGIDNTSEKALAWDELAQARREAEDAEERRIMHVAMTRAEERLILSGAVDLDKGWPAAAAGAPPLAWMGPALLPDPRALSAAAPELVRAWEHDGHPGRIRAVLNGPATVGRVLRLGPAAPGEQLSLALGDAAEVPVEPLVEDPVAAGPPRGAVPTPAAAPPRAARAAPAAASAGAAGAAPAAAPPAPATISYSSLGHYAACPYRFHLERHVRLPEQEPPEHLRDALAPAEGLDPLLRGRLVHALLERLEPGAPSPDAAAVRAGAAIHEVELAGEEVDDLLAMVRAFAASSVSVRLGGAVRVRREHGFAFPLGPDGPLVTGVVDVLAEEADGTTLVVDYKSDRVGDADLEALVQASYGVQRRIYGLACLRAGAPAVEVVHVFLERAAEPVVHRYEAADAPGLEASLRTRATGLLAGEFPVAAVPHRALCATCPGRAGLCSHPPERTDRPVEEAVSGQ